MDYEKERIVAEADRASQTRPFAKQDARLAAGAQISSGASRINPAHLAPLDDVNLRINQLGGIAGRLVESVAEIGHNLRNHADSVYGESPEHAAMGQDWVKVLDVSPPFGGSLGVVYDSLHALEDVLHRVEDSISYCARQAGRNTTLA